MLFGKIYCSRSYGNGTLVDVGLVSDDLTYMNRFGENCIENLTAMMVFDCLVFGAGNRNRTCMKLPSLEPESSASASSAIPAYLVFANILYLYLPFVSSRWQTEQNTLVLNT